MTLSSSVDLEKLVVINALPEADDFRTSQGDRERVWQLSAAELFRYTQSARAVYRELGLRPLGGAPQQNWARN